MDPRGALVSMHYQTPLGACTHHQSGIKIGNYVITVANKIFMNDETTNSSINQLTIMYSMNNNSVECIEQKEGEVVTIWQSKEVEQTFTSSFTMSNKYINRLICCTSERDHWSYFVLLKIKGSIQTSLYNNLKTNKLIVPEQGMDVLVTYTPFGSYELLNSVCEGIISNTFGANSTVFLTDARLAAASEGAPVFRNSKCNHQLIGIIVKTIPYLNDGAIHYSGFSFGVNISVLLSSLKNDMTGLNLVELGPAEDLVLPSPKDICLKTDFVVSIEVGVAKATGFIIHKSGLVMTCAHVVNFMKDVQVTLKHQDNFYDATVVYSTPKSSAIDVAILQISSSNVFPSCQIASGCPKIGESVYSIGQGELLDTFVPFLSKGVVSNNIKQFIITTCLILRGSSGGVIIRPNGEVIGVITSMMHSDETPLPFISFCTPVYLFYEIIHFFILSRDVNILHKLTGMDLRWKKPKL